MYKNASRNMQQQAMSGVRYKRNGSWQHWEAPPSTYVVPPVEWPVCVTCGMQPDGTLASREAAHEAGFNWIGHAHSVWTN